MEPQSSPPLETRAAYAGAVWMRASAAMLPILFLLLGNAVYGTYTAGALLTAVHLTAAVSATPLHARLTVLIGASAAVAVAALAYTLAMAAVLTGVRAHAPLVALLLFTAVAAALSPHAAQTPSYTHRLTGRHPAALRPSDAAAAAAPFAVAALVTVASVEIAVATAALSVSVGAIALSFRAASLPVQHRPQRDLRQRTPRTPLVWFTAVSVVGVGASLGALTLGVVAFTHAGAASGVLLSVWSLGWLVAAVVWHRRKQPLQGVRVFTWCVAGLGVMHAVLLLATHGVTLALLLFCAGAAAAPTLALIPEMLSQANTPESLRGSLPWVTHIGFSFGAVLAAVLTDTLTLSHSTALISDAAFFTASGLVFVALIAAAVVQKLRGDYEAPQGRHRAKRSCG